MFTVFLPNKYQLHLSSRLYQKNTSLALPFLDFYAQLISKPCWANKCRAQPHITSLLLFPPFKPWESLPWITPVDPVGLLLLLFLTVFYAQGGTQRTPVNTVYTGYCLCLFYSMLKLVQNANWGHQNDLTMWPADLCMSVHHRWCLLSTFSVFSFSGLKSSVRFVVGNDFCPKWWLPFL